jgi:hypothetical protein
MAQPVIVLQAYDWAERVCYSWWSDGKRLSAVEDISDGKRYGSKNLPDLKWQDWNDLRWKPPHYINRELLPIGLLISVRRFLNR